MWVTWSHSLTLYLMEKKSFVMLSNLLEVVAGKATTNDIGIDGINDLVLGYFTILSTTQINWRPQICVIVIVHGSTTLRISMDHFSEMVSWVS